MDTARILTFVLLYSLFCLAEYSDDIQVYQKQCLGEDKFVCTNGECVLATDHCDGKFDCTDDSDEINCPQAHIDKDVCNETHQFMCSDGSKCILREWVCNDAANCPDGSDEAGCTEFPDLPETPGCSGFKCGEKCISTLWLCDGRYDCDDHSDEDVEKICKHSLYPHNVKGSVKCEEVNLHLKNYNCLDYSYCLPEKRICDGIVDCRDESDEADFCRYWKNMCDKHECPVNDTTCRRQFNGYTCQCKDPLLKVYNVTTKKCEPKDYCGEDRPVCSQICEKTPISFQCSCDEGYYTDIKYKYYCIAKDSEGLMFYSTLDSIGYVNMKSKENVVLLSGVKEVNSLAFDGKYLYWAETARGHQAVMRTNIKDSHGTKETVLSIGLEEPTDVAIDFFGKNIYICDATMRNIFVCTIDVLWCMVLETKGSSPKRIVLDYKNGNMYWAGQLERPVIMSARMDGSEQDILVPRLKNFASSLALDAPNGRLYYVDAGEIHVVRLDNKKSYVLIKESRYQPTVVAVFENTVYFSDLLTNSVPTIDKMFPIVNRDMFFVYKNPIRHLSIYHDVFHKGKKNPCAIRPCSHFCFPISSSSYKCGCPHNMNLLGGHCEPKVDYFPKYLIVGTGNVFNRISYDLVAHPEAYSATFNIARVQAMTYDTLRDMLYVYDGQRRTINQILMKNFKVGLTDIIIYKNFKNVVDIHYELVADNLYILDAGRSLIEVVSLRTHKRGIIYLFKDYEIPLSFCLLSDHGKMLVALKELEQNDEIHFEFIGMDGKDRQHFVSRNFKGPIVRVRYAQERSMIYLADEGTNVIDSIDLSGMDSETELPTITSIYSIAIMDYHVFWTDKRTQKLFWSDIVMSSESVRRIELTTSRSSHPLMLAAASRPNMNEAYITQHPCHNHEYIACFDICVQKAHDPFDKKRRTPTNLGYQCLCPPDYMLKDRDCVKLAVCGDGELFCHVTNTCSKKGGARCNGNQDCPDGEDEQNCDSTPNLTTERSRCPVNKKFCLGECIDSILDCSRPTIKPYIPYINRSCGPGKFLCMDNMLCMERSRLCDGQRDCPDGYDESDKVCNNPTCFDSEFMCTSGNCILKAWKCDGEIDCNDGSDEMNCEAHTCNKGYYTCDSGDCVEMRKRCDGKYDCIDESDEFDCDETVSEAPKEKTAKCTESEYNCELDSSICIPRTARCNGAADCPGGTDENGCDQYCETKGMFNCRPLSVCIPKSKVCDKSPDCINNYDESDEACSALKKIEQETTTNEPFRPVYCPDRYICRNGKQCIEWANVCDDIVNCDDSSDEGGNCKEACLKHNCPHVCHPKPYGGHKCLCKPGYQLSGKGSCIDIDECARDICSQECVNYPGSFLCVCNPGYALRYDRRTCKAVSGDMSILYVKGHTVQSVSSGGYTSILYNEPSILYISDIDYNVREGMLYIVSLVSGNLVQVTGGEGMTTVNVGQPTKVAVDWVTGNVYFVDTSSNINKLRVCHMGKKKCANLRLRVPWDAIISALAVDPADSRLFFCVTKHLESVLWSSYLSGEKAKDFSTIRNCTALTINSYKRLLYVAEDEPAHVLEMTYHGEVRRRLYSDDPHFHTPQSIAIFEDHLYALVGPQKLIRCMLFESKHCEPYLYRTFDANKFVINHKSVQRHDQNDVCDGFQCTNICALREGKPRCVCDDGSIASDAQCTDKLQKTPIFYIYDTVEKPKKPERPKTFDIPEEPERARESEKARESETPRGSEPPREPEKPIVTQRPRTPKNPDSDWLYTVLIIGAIIVATGIVFYFGYNCMSRLFNNQAPFSSRRASVTADQGRLNPDSLRHFRLRESIEMESIQTRSRNSPNPSIHNSDTESERTPREVLDT